MFIISPFFLVQKREKAEMNSASHYVLFMFYLLWADILMAAKTSLYRKGILNHLIKRESALN